MVYPKLLAYPVEAYSHQFHPNRIAMTDLSAPAHDNILLILTMWNGWTRTLKWKASFPAVLTTYLLAQIRAASRASDEICSYSSETK
jgi:hypothetical protein